MTVECRRVPPLGAIIKAVPGRRRMAAIGRVVRVGVTDRPWYPAGTHTVTVKWIDLPPGAHRNGLEVDHPFAFLWTPGRVQREFWKLAWLRSETACKGCPHEEHPGRRCGREGPGQPRCWCGRGLRSPAWVPRPRRGRRA